MMKKKQKLAKELKIDEIIIPKVQINDFIFKLKFLTIILKF